MLSYRLEALPAGPRTNPSECRSFTGSGAGSNQDKPRM